MMRDREPGAVRPTRASHHAGAGRPRSTWCCPGARTACRWPAGCAPGGQAASARRARP